MITPRALTDSINRSQLTSGFILVDYSEPQNGYRVVPTTARISSQPSVYFQAFNEATDLQDICLNFERAESRYLATGATH